MVHGKKRNGNVSHLRNVLHVARQFEWKFVLHVSFQCVPEVFRVNWNGTKPLGRVFKLRRVGPIRKHQNPVVLQNETLELVDKPSVVVADSRKLRSISLGSTMVETVSEPHQQAIRHYNAAIPPAKNRPELLVDIFNIIGAAVAAVERETELVQGDLCEGVNRACMSECVCGCVYALVFG